MKVRTLKELRESKNVTQEQEAKEFNITTQYLSMLERGERNPSDKLKEKMADFFGVSVAYIFLASYKTKCLYNKKNTNKIIQDRGEE